MPRTRRKANGQFDGSIGSGKTHVPTPSNLTPSPTTEAPTQVSSASVDNAYTAFNQNMDGEPRFDAARQYVVVTGARTRSTFNARNTAGTSFTETLHREGCRYAEQVLPEQREPALELNGMNIPDMYRFGQIPDKVCKACLPDWHTYLEQTPVPTGYQGPRARARAHAERVAFWEERERWLEQAIADRSAESSS